MFELRQFCGRFSRAALFVLCLTAVGCTDGPDVGEVEGRVTLDGKPLAEATVTFVPDAGGRPGTGKTDAEGRYHLMFNQLRKGALLGRHQVQIRTYYPPAGVYNEQGNIVMRPERPERLPKRYHSETELSAEVKPGLTTCDFELQSK